ncbi:hypothetical protein KC960_04090 [Candidatus Saccharibacteria bacterium]|nr:hypothetical protein [Candidatus Saccharibacteria bacterium]
MARKKQKRVIKESDSAYFLKLVMYLIIGSQWVRIEHLPNWSVPIPVGLIIGLLYARNDHFKTDRRIEYAILLIVTFVSFWLPLGLYIQLASPGA